MDHGAALGEFLRSRRARLSPEDTGTPPVPGRRRVPGLRREELARLAGVSVDYYTRLEQGRSHHASPVVLDALARALRLDGTERTHLWNLADARPETAGRPRYEPPQRLRPETWDLLAMLDGGGAPAVVVGRRLDILAANRPARALLFDVDLDTLPIRERNLARLLFCRPGFRERYVDWEAMATVAVATLQFDLGRHPDDPLLGDLLSDLREASPVFRRLWAARDVNERDTLRARYRHPEAGELVLTHHAMSLPSVPDQVLLVYTAEPGSPSAGTLRRIVRRYDERRSTTVR
ncbi:helix-turn-helix transcriptional regulator [Sphaerisporangium aureirubrum]|uniref:Helix-turn-helix transcriptional regulator n=1 Tax=Sphaerisporangium aureirubrum TaxID=1544736 RepID=A0ABW1NKB1_9ACTN